MPFKFNGDIMARLKDNGWSEYKIRKERALSAATIRSIKSGVPNISMRSLDALCHMLGNVSADSVIVYSAPNTPEQRELDKQALTSQIMREWYESGKPYGQDLTEHLAEQLKAHGFI